MTTPEPKTPILLSLASELIQAITDELDIPAVCQLRLTCKDLAKFLNSQLFHTFTLDITRSTIEKVLSQLEALSTGNHAACHATRKLVIRSLSPSFNREDDWPRCALARCRPVTDTTPEEPPEVVRAKAYMDTHLFGAVASLKGVQSVEWIPNRKDNEWAHRIIMDALKTFPTLYRFKVHLSNVKFPLELDSLKYLEELTLEETSPMHHEDIFESLAKGIAQNQGLSSIGISRSWRYYRPGAPNFQNLHQLFKHYPATAPPLRLRHLALRAWLIRLDNITLPHLTHLTSLSLTRTVEDDVTHATSFTTHTQEDPSFLQERKKYGSKLEDIWQALIHAGVRLEAITADVVPNSFLDYLASYSGLKKLRLTPGGFHEGASSDATAEQFFSATLDSHVQSLEDLQIASLFEGLWCVGSHNLEVLSKCTKLKKLRMNIISSQLPSESAQQESPTEGPDDMKLLLDTVVLYMPNISIVQIVGANQEALRGSRSGNLSMLHFLAVNKKMSKSISAYEAPASCRRLPSLMLSSSGRSLYLCETSQYASTRLTSEGGLKEPRALKYVNAPHKKNVNEGYHEWL